MGLYWTISTLASGRRESPARFCKVSATDAANSSVVLPVAGRLPMSGKETVPEALMAYSLAKTAQIEVLGASGPPFNNLDAQFVLWAETIIVSRRADREDGHPKRAEQTAEC